MLPDLEPLAPFGFAMDLGDPAAARPDRPRTRVNIDPEQMQRGVVQLVLTIVELLRQLMEKQAMRRIDAGSLTHEQEERLGRSLMELDSTVRQLQAQFGIDDLNIDLGPVGKLLD